MSNYPNMSYCMFENTMAAMNQCAAAIKESLDQEIPLDLNQSERRPFDQMYEMCEHILHLLEEHQAMVEQIEEEMAEEE